DRVRAGRPHTRGSREARNHADGRNRTDRRSRCPLTALCWPRPHRPAQRRGVLMSVRGTRIPPHLQLPIAGVTPPPTEKEGQRLFPTGNFRFYRPVYRTRRRRVTTPARPVSRSRSTWTSSSTSASSTGT